ncbi:MAG: transketolase [Rhodobacteraceae bacterium]|nr:transketolase [Paracoccaceae bacterium]
MSNETMMANAIRALAMDAVQAAKSGHPGAPMGAADVATVLFNRFINIDPAADKWADRDRFVMSAGHGSMLVYAVNHLLGYEDMDMDQIRNFRQMGYRTAGHPEYGHAKGIEVTTGPLGQGISTAVGMALAERMSNARYGDELSDHFTYVIAGDGCLMEGISHEAIDFAGHMGLGKLVVMWDDNSITIDGGTEVSTSMNQQKRFEAAGWHVQSVDGHDNDAIAAAIEAARNQGDKPSMIACKTIIGFGAPNKQGTSATHGAPLGADEIAAARETLGWTSPAFEVPLSVYDDWHAVAARGKSTRVAWEARLAASSDKAAFEAALAGVDKTALDAAINTYKAQLSTDAPKVATRKASQMALEVVNATLANTVGGSADLTGSNLTKTSGMEVVTKDSFGGSYIYYGVREHGMGAIMNGLWLHGGFAPYGGTFLIFADYMRGSMRLAALMGVPVQYVLTHDSIGLGEDGPTHQPVEVIASLRAIPNMKVYRPADVVETAESWQAALSETSTPSSLALSRQGLPCLRTDHTVTNMTAKGAYILRDTNGGRDVTLIATGSEVELAVNAAEALVADGIKAAVVSAPCFEAFAEQSQDYRDVVLGSAPRVGVEAAIQQGWGPLLGCNSAFVGMTGFGASAPADELYEHFGITVDAVVAAAKSLI